LACRYRRTISMMKFLFLLGYRYIFALPSRRSRQIAVRALEIVYSFCSFVCSSSFFTWQHVPASSFSLVCILQHFVSSIDILHIPHVHNSYNYKLHTYHRVLLKNSDSYNYNFYISLFIKVLKKPLRKFFPPFFNHLCSPRFRKRTCPSPQFSIYDYFHKSNH
jgi:hypothetical protein